MKILAIDTSMSACSVALSDIDDNNITSSEYVYSERMKRGRAEQLLPSIKKLMQKSSWSFNDIDLIAVTVGPGSFTGIRVGLAVAKAIGFAANIPVAGVLTTEVIANSIKVVASSNYSQDETSKIIVIDSNRSDYYLHLFNNNNMQIAAPCAIEHKDIEAFFADKADFLTGKHVLIAGDAAENFYNYITDNIPSIINDNPIIDVKADINIAEISSVAWLGAKKYNEAVSTGNKELITPLPVYIRPPDAKLPDSNPFESNSKCLRNIQ